MWNCRFGQSKRHLNVHHTLALYAQRKSYLERKTRERRERKLKQKKYHEQERLLACLSFNA